MNMRTLPPLLVLAFTIGALLFDSGLREARSGDQVQLRVAYDPQAYYQLVNEEIVKHLRFCPYFGERGAPRGVDLRDATDAQFGLLPDDEQPSIGTGLDDECGKCDEQDRRLTGLFCLTTEAAGDPILRTQIKNFAVLSPLGTDLSILDRWSLGAEDRVEGIRAGIHRQRMPSTESGPALEFRGDISFRSPAMRKILIDAAGNERVLGGGSAPADLQAWRAEQQHTVEDGRLLRTEHALPLDWGAAKLFELPGVDDRLALLVKEAAGLRVLIDGAPIKRNMRSVLALDRGQVLEFDLPGGPPLRLRLAGERTGTISSLQLSAHGPRREIDAEAGLDGLVRGLVSGIEGSLHMLSDMREQRDALAQDDAGLDPTRLADADITLTLDRAIQMQSVDRLQRFATSPDSPLNQNGLALRNVDGLWMEAGALVPFPSLTLTIMDADRGDLLALGTYPSSQTVTHVLERVAASDGARARLLRESLGEELTRPNMHLQPHAIGSLFKPLFAWAAGEADPALVQFSLTHGEPKEDWAYDSLDVHRELTRCMVSGRRTATGSHFAGAYGNKSSSWPCPMQVQPGEDLCSALAVSDTYYFLELAVRLSLEARGLPLPATDVPERKRDEAYELSRMCRPNRVEGPDGVRRLTCEAPEREADSVRDINHYLPDTCPDSRYTNMCRVIDTLGVQLQPTNMLNEPPLPMVKAYLGPLADLIESLAVDAPEQCASGQEMLLDAFRWAVPAPPQWAQDLMVNCAPGLESFIEGGGLNYWNDIHVAQTFSRLFVGQPELRARLIASIDEKQRDRWDEDGDQADDGDDDDDAREPATFGPVIDHECAGATSARCLVLHGLDGAIRVGTLKELKSLEVALQQPYVDAGKSITVRLRGKTGTLRAPFPSFLYDNRVGWYRGTTPRKSLHTALLVEVADGSGHARHYVVYLAVQGVDDTLLSSDAAKFFGVTGPGFAVMQRVVDDAVLDLEAAQP